MRDEYAAEILPLDVPMDWHITGCLLPGADADFILIDPNEKWVYDGAKSFSKTKSVKGAYQGMELTGRITDTFVRGARVYGDGRILVEGGCGKFVAPVKKGDKC